MHVLHRFPDLRRAALAALAVAVLAIALTLVIAGGLNDLNSVPTPANAPTSHAAVHASTISSRISNPFAHTPFTSPFTAAPRPPWASTAP